MPEKPYTDADVAMVGEAIYSADPPMRNGYVHGNDLRDAEARAVLDALVAAGRLLPTGTHTVEQFNTRLYRDGELMEEPDTTQTRQHAQARIDWHARKRQEEPGWRGEAVLVRRQQHTTPWEPMPRRPSIEEALEALGDQPIGIRFWVCPIPGHSDRNGPDGRPVVTVEWRGDIAYCTADGCGRNSAKTTTEEKP